jgi:hypothetical protein
MQAAKWPMFIMNDGVLHFYDTESETTFIILLKGSKTPLAVDVTTPPSESQIASILPSWTSLARSTDSHRLQLSNATLVYPDRIAGDNIDDVEEDEGSAGPSTTVSARKPRRKAAGMASGRTKASTKKPPATRKKKQIGTFCLSCANMANMSYSIDLVSPLYVVDSDGEPEVDELKSSPTKSARKSRTTRKASAAKPKQPVKATVDIESSLSEAEDMEPPALAKVTAVPKTGVNSGHEHSGASVTTRGARLQQRNRDKAISDGAAIAKPIASSSTTSKRPLESPTDSNLPPSKKPKPSPESSDTRLSYERLKAAGATGAFQGFLYSKGLPLSITDSEEDRQVLVSQFLSSTYLFTPDYTSTIRHGKTSGQRIKFAKLSYAAFSDWAKRGGRSIDVDGEPLQLLTDEFIYWNHIDVVTSDLMES